MHRICKETDRRLSGKRVIASSTRHLAGRGAGKAVYRELYSAVTSTRQIPGASTERRRLGEPGREAPEPLPSAQLLALEEKSLLDVSSGAGPEPAAWRPASPLPSKTYSFLLHGDAAATEEPGRTPSPVAAGWCRLSAARSRHLILLLAFFFFFFKEPHGS